MKTKLLFILIFIGIFSFPVVSDELESIAQLGLEHNKRKDIETYLINHKNKQITIQKEISVKYRQLEKAFANRFVRQNKVIKLTLDINTLKEEKLDNRINKLKFLRYELTRDQYRKYIILEHSSNSKQSSIKKK
jgi:hypothetical protein